MLNWLFPIKLKFTSRFRRGDLAFHEKRKEIVRICAIDTWHDGFMMYKVREKTKLIFGSYWAADIELKSIQRW